MALADGIRGRTGASIGLGITGIAGPGGGTPEKPVGTVWFATAMGGVVRAARIVFFGTRGEVRARAAQTALRLLLGQLRER